MLLHVFFQVFCTSWPLFLTFKAVISHKNSFPIGNFECHWEDFHIHIGGGHTYTTRQTFSLPPGEVKPSSWRIPETFSHLWKTYGSNFPCLHAPEWPDEEGQSGLGMKWILVSTGILWQCFSQILLYFCFTPVASTITQAPWLQEKHLWITIF